jgi:MFS family permease
VLILLVLISMFNYIDRQILSAVLPHIESVPEFGFAGDPNPKFWLNLLGTAFLVSYMLTAPLFGWLGDRIGRRWGLVGIAIMFWSLISGASGLATSYNMLFLTRCLIGVGEGAYGPVGMAILTDVYPRAKRGMVISYVSATIPVGSALGYAVGTLVSGTGLFGLVPSEEAWRWPFFLVVAPGLTLGLICFLMPEPKRGQSEGHTQEAAPVGVLRAIGISLRTPSYVLSSAGYAAITFVTGGIAIVLIDYVYERQSIYEINEPLLAYFAKDAPDLAGRLRPLGGQRFESSDNFKHALRDAVPRSELAPHWVKIKELARTKDSGNLSNLGVIFGGIIVVAGLAATLSGSFLADLLRPRMPSSDFFVSAIGAVFGFPMLLAFMFAPFPLAWGLLFLAVFGLFLNTGPVNTILANVTDPAIRATAFAFNIFLIHALGDVISPPIIGAVTDRFDWITAVLVISGMVLVSAALWFFGMRFLKRDTELAAQRVA